MSKPAKDNDTDPDLGAETGIAGEGRHYSIGAVARLTGVSTQLLRAWEQRYGAITPVRSDNGRRCYDRKDVEKISLLKALTDRGMAISSIAALDRAALQAQLGETDSVAQPPGIREIRVAALGALLPQMLQEDVAPQRPITLIAHGNELERFLADARGLAPDLLIVESSSLGPETGAWLARLRDITGAKDTLIAYGFARREDERALADDGFRLLRTPVSSEELATLVMAVGLTSRAGAASATPAPDAPQRPPVEIPPRRFTESQLAALTRIKSEVDCECPNHMADVVRTLAAFESYCAECEDRNEADAAVHAYLHQSTAQARAGMETALAHLVEMEGISI